MKNGFLKVAAVTPKTRVADALANAEICAEAAREAVSGGAKIVVFPELTLTTAGLSDLFLHKSLTDAAKEALRVYIARTEELDAISVIGFPAEVGGALYNAAAVVCRGELVGVVPATNAAYPFVPAADSFFELDGGCAPLGSGFVFKTDGAPNLALAVCFGEDIYSPLSTSRLYHSGANVVVCLASEPEHIGAVRKRRNLILSESDRLAASLVYCGAGISETGTDSVSSGYSAVAECGELIAERAPFESGILYSVIDTEKTSFVRKKHGFITDNEDNSVELELTAEDTELLPFNKYPFIPSCDCELGLALDIQAEALAARFERSYSKRLVIGISGGLDSTLALLVCRRATDILGRNGRDVTPSIITAVTMPCFGTTKRTRSNAEKLSLALGAELRCVDIQAAVSQHFCDIGHSKEDYSVVYENAQARERTQVLMDIANACGGLVVGTGDLSEVALGWSTYNGDHMSMYGVNASVPKTLVRRLVSYYADNCTEGETAEILRDILATPVSPELLPPTSDGEIAQCTEGIVGPYELHDFFLYWFARYGYSPEKIYRMARVSFADTYDADTVKGWLAVFVRRFITQQFKRSCMPDGPLVTEISLSPRGAFNMPSDASFAVWLKSLEESE